MSYQLPPNGRLSPGQFLEQGKFKLLLQTDGNLVLFNAGKAIWQSGAAGRGAQLIMQSDGPLVLLNGQHKPFWSANSKRQTGSATTTGRVEPGSYLTLLPSGNLAVVGRDPSKPLWQTNTTGGEQKKKAQFFPDPLKAVKSVGSAIGHVATLKISKAGADLGRAANSIAGAQLVQSVIPGLAIPTSILAAAATNGPQGALDAAHAALNNPALKTTIAASGVVFPPLAPASAGLVAGMEASSRVLDAIESGDPKQVAGAALQLASTAALAASGNPGAARAKDMIDKVSQAREIAKKVAAGDPSALAGVANLASQAGGGNEAAKNALSLYHSVTARQALKGKLPSAALSAVHKEAPALLSMVAAGLSTPTGVKAGDFTVLKTGRILHKGAPMKHGFQHKTAVKGASANRA